MEMRPYPIPANATTSATQQTISAQRQLQCYQGQGYFMFVLMITFQISKLEIGISSEHSRARIHSLLSSQSTSSLIAWLLQ